MRRRGLRERQARPGRPARDRPGSRQEIHALFEQTLEAFGARLVDVRGDFPEREARAVAAVDALLAAP